MSAIGWVDFSSEHREKVKSVIDLLATPGVIDELGIGVIRDSFSDSLFPGISTIQTRAKYFVTVPRIFRDYEKLPANKRRRQRLADYLNDQENLCMEALVENHADDPQDGIIGERFYNKQGEVQRKPSSAYWVGIRQFGLIRTELSLQAFCRKYANPDQSLLELVKGTDKSKGDDPDVSENGNEGIVCPAYDPDWINQLSLNLSVDEATFLSNQIAAKVPHSLLGQALLDPNLREQFVELPNNWNFTALADEASFVQELPSELTQTILAARDFWQLMCGAHIRYNCLLQEQHGTKSKKTEFDSEWEGWLEELAVFNWDRWNTGALWNQVKLHQRRVRNYTVQFVEAWIDGLRNHLPLEKLDKLVANQERYNKKSRARLQPNSQESVNDWIGISDLNYRLFQARTIIRDIHNGLSASESNDAGR
jgi:Family of unknown function (DUF6361)